MKMECCSFDGGKKWMRRERKERSSRGGMLFKFLNNQISFCTNKYSLYNFVVKLVNCQKDMEHNLHKRWKPRKVASD